MQSKRCSPASLANQRVFAAVVSTVLGGLAFLTVLALEIAVAALVLGVLLPSGSGNTAVDWDPVSFWYQSVRGKVFLIFAGGIPVAVALLASVMVSAYAYRRLTRPTVTPSTQYQG